MTTEALSQQALLLPVEERAALAEQLLASLDDIPEAEIEQLWFAEAARRAAQIDSGAVQRIAGEQVRQEALARLR